MVVCRGDRPQADQVQVTRLEGVTSAATRTRKSNSVHGGMLYALAISSGLLDGLLGELPRFA